MSKFCEYCGAPLEEDSRFCTSCGHPVARQSQPTQQPRPSQQAQQPRPQQQPRGGQQQTSQQGYQYRQSSNSVNFQPSPQAYRPQPPKKKGGFLKVLLIVALIAVLGYGAEEYYQYRHAKKVYEELTKDYPEKMEKLRQRKQVAAEPQEEEEPQVIDYPKVTIEGEGYKLEVPESNGNLECAPMSDERVAELKRQGHNFITKPIMVTSNGKEHVNLDGLATVSIEIPKDFPKEEYVDLVGVLISDNKTEYCIPDYAALQEGVVKFKTSHFSGTAVEKDPKKLREQYINFVAYYGYQCGMKDKDLEPTWREQLTGFANGTYKNEINLASQVATELLTEFDLTGNLVKIGTEIVSIGNDIIDAHDLDEASLEQRAEVASKTILEIVRRETLGYLFSKLKEDEKKEVKVLDESKKNPSDFTYKKELKEIESRRNKIIKVCEDQFSLDNVKEMSKKLGEGPSLEQCYVAACDALVEKGKDYLKSKTVEMVPYVKTVQIAYKAMSVAANYVVAKDLDELYKKYKNLCDQNEGNLLDDDLWGLNYDYLFGIRKSYYGMDERQMRDMFEERYQEEQEIKERKIELEKLVNMIQAETMILSEFDTVSANRCETTIKSIRKLDFAQRLTRVLILKERFEEELSDRVLVGTESGNRFLLEVIQEYLILYPDQKAFYKWLADKGYYHDKLEKNYYRLDEILWNDNDPQVTIAIQESVIGTEESGSAKYVGRTICIGSKGKPYKGWHRNIPDVDTILDYGWRVEFPDDDSVCYLSRYKEMGMPNQVLIYANEADFKKGKKPIETIDFVVDTTGVTTEVELNQKEKEPAPLEFVGIGFTNDWGPTVHFFSLIDAVVKSRFILDKEGNFSVSSNGVYDETGTNNSYNEKGHITVSGHVDRKTGEGTFTMSAEITTQKTEPSLNLHFIYGTNMSETFNASGKVTMRVSKYSNNSVVYLSCSNGPDEEIYHSTIEKTTRLTEKGREYYKNSASDKERTDTFHRSEKLIIGIQFEATATD